MKIENKTNAILHARSAFHDSFVQRQLHFHGETVTHVGIGNYYHYTDSGWIKGDKTKGKQIIEPSELKGFLGKYGNKQPVHIPDSVWIEMEDEINREQFGD